MKAPFPAETPNPLGLMRYFECVIGGHFELIPRHSRLLPEFRVADEDWESLALPINLSGGSEAWEEISKISYRPAERAVLVRSESEVSHV